MTRWANNGLMRCNKIDDISWGAVLFYAPPHCRLWGRHFTWRRSAMATRIPLALLATALACSLFAAPAHALRARVFVAKTGADVGSCSFSAPCQSLNFAYNAVLPGGEIT